MTHEWRVGEVFTNGKYRWRVISVTGELAVLQSCDTKWATTRLLTYDEWNEDGKWQIETATVPVSEASGSVPSAAQKENAQH